MINRRFSTFEYRHHRALWLDEDQHFLKFKFLMFLCSLILMLFFILRWTLTSRLVVLNSIFYTPKNGLNAPQNPLTEKKLIMVHFYDLHGLPISSSRSMHGSQLRTCGQIKFKFFWSYLAKVRGSLVDLMSQSKQTLFLLKFWVLLWYCVSG